MEITLGVNDYDPTACKLRICRQLRNFITHNDSDGFITIAPGMIKFLKELKKEIKSDKNKTKNKTKAKTKKGARKWEK